MLGHVQQRRVFRGRGGPNDRRLPKHNARRRRRPPEPNRVVKDDVEEDDGSSVEEDEVDESKVVEEEEQLVNHHSTESLEPTEEPLSHFQNEVNHFQQRVKNVKYSIQTSTLALNTTSTYQNNVLRAILNCAMEWKSILKYHAIGKETAETSLSICKACALSLFELIQLGLQCGPLAGSKPGYFKRCGSETATMVHDFLQELAPEKDSLIDLCCSEKQADAVERWKKDAQKAIVRKDEPSKHVQKRMHEAAKRRAEN
ncbi:hypothetical protein FisN_12Lu264 [Fistulifera solaris]|jgi:hypothetical protein|uniref:Uncharacterized protein n=1 Tax=Fistulifera solaris TaxID=1519565 RepID=A0A1Z5JMD9_FISSO|nr:hypothetical protein FisN_12Lu264 [Fistulifera solaris]|eukprot:GAX15154.1 hypothetical protein FisN_12Lu264 [Fistulifera solaris]